MICCTCKRAMTFTLPYVSAEPCNRCLGDKIEPPQPRVHDTSAIEAAYRAGYQRALIDAQSEGFHSPGNNCMGNLEEASFAEWHDKIVRGDLT